MTSTESAVTVQIFNMLVSFDASPAARPLEDASSTEARNRLVGWTTFTFLVFDERTALTVNHVRDDLSAFVARHVPREIAKLT